MTEEEQRKAERLNRELESERHWREEERNAYEVNMQSMRSLIEKLHHERDALLKEVRTLKQKLDEKP